MRGHFPLERKERQLSQGLAISVEDFDGFDPGRLLAVIDFPQIKG
jgi:hypothetical protein